MTMMKGSMEDIISHATEEGMDCEVFVEDNPQDCRGKIKLSSDKEGPDKCAASMEVDSDGGEAIAFQDDTKPAVDYKIGCLQEESEENIQESSAPLHFFKSPFSVTNADALEQILTQERLIRHRRSVPFHRATPGPNPSVRSRENSPVSTSATARARPARRRENTPEPDDITEASYAKTEMALKDWTVPRRASAPVPTCLTSITRATAAINSDKEFGDRIQQQ